MARIPRTILCRHCDKRFVAKRTGRGKKKTAGINKRQRCPFCERIVQAPLTKSQWCDLTWYVFSKFIRMDEADSNGIATCVTCGVRYHWSHFQAGHYLRGRTKGILYLRCGVHCQCNNCNRADPHELYTRWMLENEGQDTIDLIVDAKWKHEGSGNWTIAEYEDVFNEYCGRILRLWEHAT